MRNFEIGQHWLTPYGLCQVWAVRGRLGWLDVVAVSPEAATGGYTRGFTITAHPEDQTVPPPTEWCGPLSPDEAARVEVGLLPSPHDRETAWMAYDALCTGQYPEAIVMADTVRPVAPLWAARIVHAVACARLGVDL